jgi:hypothetical protein
VRFLELYTFQDAINLNSKRAQFKEINCQKEFFSIKKLEFGAGLRGLHSGLVSDCGVMDREIESGPGIRW